MATVEDQRAHEPGETSPQGSESPAVPPPGPGRAHPVRMPRLLVAASEMSWRFLVCAAAAAVVVWALMQVGFVFIPVLIALLLSTLLVPPARWLQRRGLPPLLATVLVFLGGLGVVAGLVALVAPPVVDEFDQLADQVRGGVDELGDYIADSPLGLDRAEVQEQIDQIDDRIRDNADAIRDGVVSGAQAAGQFLAGLGIMLVVLFFFVKDGGRMWDWVRRAAPSTRRPALDDLGERCWRVLTAYVHGVVFVAFVDAVGIGLGLWIIGIPLVLPLAVLTFMLAFIPILGAITAGAAAVLVALVSEGPVAALLVLGVVVLVQQLESNVLYPNIVGRTIRIHPVVVLLAVASGGLLYGIVGAALAVPFAIMGIAAASVIRRHSVQGEIDVGPAPVSDEEPG
jgi:putative heme transporter